MNIIIITFGQGQGQFLSLNKETKCLSIDASDICWNYQLVKVINAKRQTSVTYRNPKPIKDNEGEITHWILTSNELKSTETLTIYND